MRFGILSLKLRRNVKALARKLSPHFLNICTLLLGHLLNLPMSLFQDSS